MFRQPISLHDYFRAEPAWAEILSTARERFERLGRVGGAFQLSSEHALAARRLGCRLTSRNLLTLDSLENALRASSFDCSLETALEVFFGERPISRPAERQALSERWSEATRIFQDDVSRCLTGDLAVEVSKWWTRDVSYIRPEWRQNPEFFQGQVRIVVSAIGYLRGCLDPVSIPVLANECANDPHALDDGTARRLLERVLAHLHQEIAISWPLSAENRDALFSAANLCVDDISSGVTVAGLLGDSTVLAAARESWLPWTVPLLAVKQIPSLSAPRRLAHLVENPSVFRHLWRSMLAVPSGKRPTLICTNGQLSLAARRLLDLLVEGGVLLRYSGDFDSAGLGIACGLQQRYGIRLSLWRMSIQDYRIAKGRQTLESAPTQFASSLAAEVEKNGPGFQESLIPELEADLASLCED